MKRYIKIFLSFIAAAAVAAGGCVFAADSAPEVSWRGDYSSMELVVGIKPSVNYIQRFSVVMYPAAIASPARSDYCRAAEVTVNPGESGEVRFRLTDSLNADGGEYKVLVQGSGYMSAESRKEETVCILRPSDISGEGGLLAQINAANSTAVTPLLKRAAESLQIAVSDEERASRLNAFVNIRSTDYGSRFKTMEDVRTAWQCSDVIDYIAGGGSDTAVLKTKLSECSAALGIDVSDEDYAAYTESIYKMLIVVGRSFGGSGVKNCSDVKLAFRQSKALAVINNTEIEGMATVAAKYYGDVGVTAETYGKYSGLSDSDRQKVQRQWLKKGFTDVTVAAKAFSDAVAQFGNSDPTPTPNPGTGGGGGGGGTGGIGGGYSAPVTDSSAANNPPKTELFSDCGEEHWAYQYVKTLAQSGVISGYSDGSFCPEKTAAKEEFVKLAILASGLYSEADCDFSDVPKGEWFYGYVAAANKNGIITGDENGRFGTGSEVTREDAAVIVCRILTLLGKAENVSADEADFADSGAIQDYAAESVMTLKAMGILNGFEDGSFRPQARLTRAETAKLIYMLKARAGK